MEKGQAGEEAHSVRWNARPPFFVVRKQLSPGTKEGRGCCVCSFLSLLGLPLRRSDEAEAEKRCCGLSFERLGALA